MQNNKLLDVISEYQRNGFVIIKAYNSEEHKILSNFTLQWVKQVIKLGGGKTHLINDLPIEKYHEWFNEMGIIHDGLFRATNRYIVPPKDITKILLNSNVTQFIKSINANNTSLWNDPGFGWLGFRMIRPNMNDGYPASCKNWGQAAGVTSIWVPIIGYSNQETLALVPGSHIKEYKKYLPEGSKFTSGEFRLSNEEDELKFIRPELKPGEIIVYHAGILHTEDVIESAITRLNVEYRFRPKAKK